jgi:NADP-dependent 3-hydroxy acid dehydrogenase YdfG
MISPARLTSENAPVAVITGASAGVGRATAIAFARRGYRVALLARGEAGLEGARRDVEAAGGSALTISVDMSDDRAVDAAAESVVAAWSRIDVWVNNAMVTVFGPADRVTPAEWQRVTNVTYLGAVYGTLAALRHMKQRDAGTIIQVGSALAYLSIPLQAPYCGAKAALRGFTDSLRRELLHDGSHVRLTMVQLPGVNTPQFIWSRTHMRTRHQPVGAVYSPEAVARAIADVALKAPREVWVGVPTFEAILGALLGPGLLDRFVARSTYEPQENAVPSSTDFDIMDHPAASDHGERGPFTAREVTHAAAQPAGAVRGAFAMALLGTFALIAVFTHARRRPRRG